MSVGAGATSILNSVSFWALIAALGSCSIIIVGAMINGMLKSRAEERKALKESMVKHG
jgi:Flp pilus assembly pilin Flp